MNIPVLFAAGLDWLEGVLPFLFVLFWIVSQVFNAFKAMGRGRPQPPVVRPPRPAPNVPRADDIRGQLERQIGEFLERQAGQRDRPDERPRQPVRQRPAAKASAGRQETRAGRVPPPLPAATPAKPKGAERGAVAAAGSDVARHVHDAFAHELDHLSTSIAAGAPVNADVRQAMAPPAAELVNMLRNPATLRQLILLREVLDRPTERW
jgi:hypothetical protein